MPLWAKGGLLTLSVPICKMGLRKPTHQACSQGGVGMRQALEEELQGAPGAVRGPKELGC